MIKTTLAPFTVVGVVVAGTIACSAPQPHSSNGEPPIAALVDPFQEVIIGQTVTFDGADSYDPDNAAPAFPHGIESFSWSLVRPGGSNATLAYGTDGMATLTTDVAGEYAGELVVIDMDGLESEPAPFGVTADHPSDEMMGLNVTVTWADNTSDMDLHLVQSGGQFYVAPGDCHYANANPDWGEPGDANDPTLEIDLVSGPGPEVIRLRQPQTTSYDVFAHFNSDDGFGPSHVDIGVTHNGVVVANPSLPSLANDFVWHVGTVAYADSNAAPSFSLIDSVFQNP